MRALNLYFIFALCSDSGVVILPDAAVLLLWANAKR